MFESVFASIIFEITGAFIKWLYYSLKHYVKGKKIKSFQELWRARKSENEGDIIARGVSNVFLGVVVWFVFMIIIVAVFFRPPYTN